MSAHKFRPTADSSDRVGPAPAGGSQELRYRAAYPHRHIHGTGDPGKGSGSRSLGRRRLNHVSGKLLMLVILRHTGVSVGAVQRLCSALLEGSMPTYRCVWQPLACAWRLTVPAARWWDSSGSIMPEALLGRVGNWAPVLWRRRNKKEGVVPGHSR